jgi:hypothetical protein
LWSEKPASPDRAIHPRPEVRGISRKDGNRLPASALSNPRTLVLWTLAAQPRPNIDRGFGSFRLDILVMFAVVFDLARWISNWRHAVSKAR